MKTIVIRNADSSAYVEFATDLGSSSEGLFTIMEIRGLSNAEENAGIDFKLLADDVSKGIEYSTGYFKDWATTNNYICEIKSLEGAVVTLVATQVALDITNENPLTAGQVGVAYSETLESVGGNTPKTWAVTVGTLPAGLSLESATGKITGTPTTAATSNITVVVTDAYGITDTLATAITIAP